MTVEHGVRAAQLVEYGGRGGTWGGTKGPKSDLPSASARGGVVKNRSCGAWENDLRARLGLARAGRLAHFLFC